jgi:LPS-assembly lipoprotein
MRLATLLVVLTLAGCGFQLRGEAQLPSAMTRTYIAAPRPNDALPRQVAVLLKANEIQVVKQRSGASAILVIEEDRMLREVQSVGATARVREFVLRYLVRFHLEDPAGEILMPTQTMELREDYQFDQQQVLGTTSEEELLRRELVRTMSGHILRRLENAGRS